MTARIWPADAVTGAPSYTGRYLRQVLGAFLGGHTSARPLGARSGVTPGTPATTVAATSTTWTVTPHCGVLDAEASALAGPYMYSFDVNVTGAMTAANGSNPRIDNICVQLSDPAESDGTSTPGVAIIYTAGIAGAPSVTRGATGGPPVIPARSIELAQINVPVSGGGSPSVSWDAPYSTAAGGIIPVSGSAFYPASSDEGQYIDDATYGLMRFDGSNFGTPIGSIWQAIQATGTAIPNNVATTVVMDTMSVNTTGVSIGGGSFRAPIAGVYMVSGSLKFPSAATGARGGQFALNGTLITGSNAHVPAQSTDTTQVTLPTIYVTCAVSDVISMQAVQDSGGSLTLVGGSFFACVRM